MLELIEKYSMRFLFYWIVLCLCIGTVSLTSLLNLPTYFTPLAILIGLLLVSISFTSFRLQVYSQSSKKIVLAVLLSPIIFYIPLNILLYQVGYVNPPMLFLDFGAYYNAAIRYLSGYPLYTTSSNIPELQSVPFANMEYLYPPIFVLIFIPFTLTSPMYAGYLWGLISILFLMFSIRQLVLTYNVGFDRREKLLFYYLIISFGPLISWVKHGNMSGILAGLLCLSGAALRAEKDFLSGALTTITATVKPYYATSGAYFLHNRDRLLGATAATITFILLSYSFFGVDVHTNYFEVLIHGEGWGKGLPTPDEWSAGQYNPFYAFGRYKNLVRVFIILITAIVALYTSRHDVSDEYIYALGVVIVPTAAPVTFTYTLTAIIPAAIMLVLYDLETNEKLPIPFIIGILLVHIHPYTVDFLAKFGPNIYPPMRSISWIVPIVQPALWGSVVMFGFILYRIKVQERI